MYGVKMRYFLLLLLTLFSIIKPTDITYRWHDGRMGDNIINVVKCRYLSYKYNIPFLFSPFPHADFFAFSRHPHASSTSCTKKTTINSEQELNHKKIDTHALYESNFYTTLTHPDIVKRSYVIDRSQEIYDYAIKHPDFYAQLIDDLKPIQSYQQLKVPKDRICIAVHIRKGGGYDAPIKSKQFYKKPSQLPATSEKRNGRGADESHPFKFPPNQYFVDQIGMISELLGNPPLFVYIFTDDNNPQILCNQIKQAVHKPNITFGCRTYDNHHSKNILDDLCNMAYQFDCLIRSASSFAWVAQLIGNHKVIISPTDCTWYQDMLIMSSVEMIIPHTAEDYIERYKCAHRSKEIEGVLRKILL